MNTNLFGTMLTTFPLAAGSLRRELSERLSAPSSTLRDSRCRAPHGKFTRFEPVTVRAAARVLRLQQSGAVNEREAAFYVAELASMDAYAGRDAALSLLRVARRKSRRR